MTVSAPVRFMPTPPLRVDSMKMKILGLLLKRCIKICITTLNFAVVTDSFA